MARLDMTEVRKLLNLIEDIADDLHGRDDTDPVERTKFKSKERAETSRKLVYGAHLCDLAAAEMRNQFHRFKGEKPPSIQT